MLFGLSKLISIEQALWLKFAYDLEMLGQPVHLQLWSASVVFVIVNMGVLAFIVKNVRKAKAVRT